MRATRLLRTPMPFLNSSGRFYGNWLFADNQHQNQEKPKELSYEERMAALDAKLEEAKNHPDVIKYSEALEKWRKPEQHPEIDETLKTLFEVLTKVSIPHKHLIPACLDIKRPTKEVNKAVVEIDGPAIIGRNFNFTFTSSVYVSSGLLLVAEEALVGRNQNPYPVLGYLRSPIGATSLFSVRPKFDSLKELGDFKEAFVDGLDKAGLSKLFDHTYDAKNKEHGHKAIHLDYDIVTLSEHKFDPQIWKKITYYTGVGSNLSSPRNPEPIQIAIPHKLMQEIRSRYSNSHTRYFAERRSESLDDLEMPIG